MTIEVLGKEYEVIEIIPKKYPEQDLFICKSELGYKECFQRFDIGREKRIVKMTDAVHWTYEENFIIQEALKNGKTATEISKYEKLNRHTQSAIYKHAIDIKREMILKEEAEREKRKAPRFKVRF